MHFQLSLNYNLNSYNNLELANSKRKFIANNISAHPVIFLHCFKGKNIDQMRGFRLEVHHFLEFTRNIPVFIFCTPFINYIGNSGEVDHPIPDQADHLIPEETDQ